MHYYKRNLGDYAKKAGRLSMLQHGSYTLLIDACYDREQFPTLDEAIEWTWASSTEEIEAVTFVLRKFFTLEDGVYVQKRIQEEITEYHGKAATNKRIAEDRERKRRSATTNGDEYQTIRERSVDEAPPNQEPLTTNQEPKTKERATRKRGARKCPDDFSITDEMRGWAANEASLVNIDSEMAVFRDYTFKTAKTDWLGTWRNWMRRCNDGIAERQKFPAKQARPSTHSGFENRDYREGIADDGTFS